MLSYLDLHGNKLNGSIPKNMGKLDHLLMLDLSHNQLTGSIPGDVIAHFKDMQMYLNLSYNHFVGNVPFELGMLEMAQAIDVSNNNLSGVLPKTLVGCRNMFSLDFSGNNISAKFLRPCRENDHSVSKKAIAIIAALGSLAVLLLVVLLILYLNRGTIFGNSAKTSDTENHESVHGSSMGLKRFSPKELEYATGCFSSDYIIGASSLSTVYKGQFEDGQVVAIKSLNLHQFSANTDKIFKREASTLCQLRHRNLVKILGYAWEKFAYMKKVTTKVDVFSFGIIVMEFLTRKRPTGLSEEDSSLISLRDVVAKAVANGTEQIINIVDPELITKDHGEVLEELFKLSLCCTFSDPEHRPNMNEVLSALVKLKTAR
ncbi:hypothetical protein TSUD_83260 [Trifolium subterraneum]|uniref:non-specific serine/threonine protein kinase n=1 Tax=Trifolium subterraneum TaxID=3900 RepID=A0A2Z6N710_TRISU|nr:hypothetical protein TSUD_83260 [Trifolium subterraneum]